MLSVSVLSTDLMLPFSATSKSAGQHSVKSSPWPSDFDPPGAFGGGASWSHCLAQQDSSLEIIPDSDDSFTLNGSFSDEMSGYFGSMSLYSQFKGMPSSDMFLMDPNQHVSDGVSPWGSLDNVYSEAYLDRSGSPQHIAEVCNIERQTNLLYQEQALFLFIFLIYHGRILFSTGHMPCVRKNGIPAKVLKPVAC